MSLILEALRKSEAERRRGQVPELFDAPVVPSPPPAAPRRRPAARLPGPALTGGLAALALVVAVGVWLRDDGASGPQRTPTAGDATAVAASGTDIPASAAPVRPPAPAPLAAVDPAGSSAPATMPAAAATAQSAPVPAASARSTAGPRTAAPLDPPVPMAPAQPSPAPVALQPASTPSRVPVPAMASTPPAPAPPPAVDADLLRLADLAPDERQQLPTLRMSMHMWAPEPAQRFVILDGTRMAEGDRVGDAVIESITRDGAVLAWRGRRLRVPVR